jgi:hypothetical protein
MTEIKEKNIFKRENAAVTFLGIIAATRAGFSTQRMFHEASIILSNMTYICCKMNTTQQTECCVSLKKHSVQRVLLQSD